MNQVTQIPFPAESQIHPLLAAAYYHDAFSAEMADPALTPIEMMVRFGAAFPDWGEALMTIRNGVVKHLGIRDVGAFRKSEPGPPKPPAVGGRFGIFHILAMDENELVLGIDDSHLNVRISVLKRSAHYVLGSVVTTHNWLGRLYMLPVGPLHRLIVRATMRRARV
jgi:hypothetical protein